MLRKKLQIICNLIMFKVAKVEVSPLREKFGIQHKIYIEGDTNALKDTFKKFASAQSLNIEDNYLEINFSPERGFKFEFDKPLEDYYTEEIHSAWKDMVASAMGMEEPFRFYSFYTLDGKHLGTVGFKQDCENAIPIILVYQNF